jgi:dual specificity phosphatase 12
MSKKPETCRVLVVSLNRPRLAKIISLLEESQSNKDAEDESAGLVSVNVEFLPCIATMGSYEAEDGSQKRYLATVIYHDGSQMTKFFDDEDIRPTLSLVAMVGYEWKDQDKVQLENFFKANNLTIEIDCVQANQEFESLQQEMECFKELSKEEKGAHQANQTMGPGKMVGFLVNAADHVKEEKLWELQPPQPVEESDAAQTEESSAIEDAIPQRLPPDPNLTMFACRMCRTVLFGEDDLATDHVQNLHSFRYTNFNQKRSAVECQSFFCNDNVLGWLSPSGQDIEGKLACTKCSAKIGHWKWAGAQCSCGTWVTPAIQIPASKVDTIRPVSKAAPIGTITTPIW